MDPGTGKEESKQERRKARKKEGRRERRKKERERKGGGREGRKEPRAISAIARERDKTRKQEGRKEREREGKKKEKKKGREGRKEGRNRGQSQPLLPNEKLNILILRVQRTTTSSHVSLSNSPACHSSCQANCPRCPALPRAPAGEKMIATELGEAERHKGLFFRKGWRTLAHSSREAHGAYSHG
ncbi:nst1, partial [Ophiophagus hannah]